MMAHYDPPVALTQVQSRERQGAPVAAAGDPSRAWARPAGLVLVVSLLAAAFAVQTSAITLLFGSTNKTDWVEYLLTLAVLVPGAFAGGRWLTRAVESAGGPAAVSALAARATVGLLAIVILARLIHSAGGSSSVVLLPLVLAWGAALALAAHGTRQGRGIDVRPLGDTRRAWALAAVLAYSGVFAFLAVTPLRPLQVAASIAVAAALTVLHLRLPSSKTPRSVLLLTDVVVIGLVILTITDVTGYLDYLRPDAKTYMTEDGVRLTPQFFALYSRIHEGFWLGPLNDMLHGRAMLVDASSQYGVGVFYFLAAFFRFAPLGYGALGLLAGLLTALQYALAYGVMRLAGAARTLAIPAAGVAVVGLALVPTGSPNDVPSTGGLRFGLPWLLIAVAVLSERRPGLRQVAWVVALALVGIASIWSFETFVYTGAVFAAAAAFDCASLESDGRLGAFFRRALTAAACCLAAHAVLALGTRAFAGSWPDWSTYLAFLRAYSGQNLFIWVVEPWSPGIPVLLFHLASAMSVAGLLLRRHELVCRRGAMLMGIATTSALGIVTISYFVGNSYPSELIYTTLPALVEGCLWVAVLDASPGRMRALRIVAVGAAFWAAALIVVPVWHFTTEKWHRSALAQVVPDGGRGGSLRYSVRRLWHSPPSDPRVVDAQALLDRHLPSGAPALVLVEPELTVETLVRSGRVNLVPISHPEQENIVPKQAGPRILATIDRLPPGTLMLAQPAAFDAPTKAPGAFIPGQLVRLQKLALARIRAHFLLQEIDRSASGLTVVRLVRRRGA